MEATAVSTGVAVMTTIFIQGLAARRTGMRSSPRSAPRRRSTKARSKARRAASALASGGVGDGDDVVAFAFETEGERLADVDFIVDDENVEREGVGGAGSVMGP